MISIQPIGGKFVVLYFLLFIRKYTKESSGSQIYSHISLYTLSMQKNISIYFSMAESYLSILNTYHPFPHVYTHRWILITVGVHAYYCRTAACISQHYILRYYMGILCAYRRPRSPGVPRVTVPGNVTRYSHVLSTGIHLIRVFPRYKYGIKGPNSGRARTLKQQL